MTSDLTVCKCPLYLSPVINGLRHLSKQDSVLWAEVHWDSTWFAGRIKTGTRPPGGKQYNFTWASFISHSMWIEVICPWSTAKHYNDIIVQSVLPRCILLLKYSSNNSVHLRLMDTASGGRLSCYLHFGLPFHLLPTLKKEL